MMGSLALGIPGGIELVIVLLVCLLLFGKRLPSVARSMGQSLMAFKAGARDATSIGLDEELPKSLASDSADTKATTAE